MVAVNGRDGPARLAGCAPLHKLPQTRWSARLTVQMGVYVLFIGACMASGGLMPWILERVTGGTDSSSRDALLDGQRDSYVFVNNNSYAYCPKRRIVQSGAPLQRGYPAPPLSLRGGQLYEAWYHERQQLAGVTWPGFDSAEGGFAGLRAGGSSAATDLQAVVFQLKLLGFNTIRLPFSFDLLQQCGADQAVACHPSSKAAWAKRATDPAMSPQPNLAAPLPDPAVYLHVPSARAGTCNTYLPGPGAAMVERLAWTLQFLSASGLYVVLSYKPRSADDVQLRSAQGFAQAWLQLWATLTCLPTYARDIRGRLLLDLVDEPDGAGIGWTSSSASNTPGLQQLYLAAMDSIEAATANDALYMLQGAGGKAFGLAAGDGCVCAIISSYQLSDPRAFFSELISRPYSNRVLLAPHMHGPGSDGSSTRAAPPTELRARLFSSWGVLARNGFCTPSGSPRQCMRFPVIAGEVGSALDSAAEVRYLTTVAGLTNLAAGASSNASSAAGWIWAPFTPDGSGSGSDLVTPDGQGYAWPKLRFLARHFGLRPWFADPTAFIRAAVAAQADALTARLTADADAATAATVAVTAVAGLPRPSTVVNLTSLVLQLSDAGSNAGSAEADASPQAAVQPPAAPAAAAQPPAPAPAAATAGIAAVAAPSVQPPGVAAATPPIAAAGAATAAATTTARPPAAAPPVASGNTAAAARQAPPSAPALPVAGASSVWAQLDALRDKSEDSQLPALPDISSAAIWADWGRQHQMVMAGEDDGASAASDAFAALEAAAPAAAAGVGQRGRRRLQAPSGGR